MDALAAIRSRRTVKDFTGAALDRPTLETLLDAARWAPTHRLSEPWRFAVLDQATIARLSAWLATQPQIRDTPDTAKGPAKLAKLLERLPTLGALIQVTWVRATDPEVDREDLAATAAATQNLLLAATAVGIGSFWSTNPALGHPDTQRWCGSDPVSEGFLGSLWLGIAKQQPPAPPRRSLSERVRWLS